MFEEFFSQLESFEIAGSEFSLFSLIIGGIIMLVGIVIARIARIIFNKYYAPVLPEHTAKNFGKMIYFGIIIIAFLVFVTTTGIDFTGLVMAGGILGIVIGFATQSVVSNLLSGIFLLIEKPAKQGDSIELPDSNISGSFVDVGTFSSRVRKFDGTIMRIPNEKFFTSNIRVLTDSPVRRHETMIGIAYKEDIDAAIEVLKKTISARMPFVLHEPEPEFRIEELGDSSVNILILVWHPKQDWGKVAPVLLKIAKNALDDVGIEIPFPQRVIWNGDKPKE
ncbi:MAG: mechanosensitive ion channel family protein [Nitrosopumilus sp.]|nr:mechanosensitive ion channel family protein [Nitrosopumilus sp.]MDH3386192.1 mechanosensitive ion channel family protein [Nitrosopumilus sp.]